MKFGFEDDQYNRCKALFEKAKVGEDFVDIADYVFNGDIRKAENPNNGATGQDYQKALFYMYGHCEDLYDFDSGSSVMAHSLLKKFEFYKTSEEAMKVLSKQIVKVCDEESENLLMTDE